MTSLRDMVVSLPQYTEDVIRAALKTELGSRIVWIVVEDKDDADVYRKVFSESTTRIQTSDDRDTNSKYNVLKGCEHVERIVSAILTELPTARVCGIRDADYTRFMRNYVCPMAVFRTEQRDVEMMLLSANSVISALNNWNANFSERIESCAEEVRKIGYIRIYNDVENLGVNISKIVKNKYLWNQNEHKLVEGWFDNLLNRMLCECPNASKECLWEIVAMLELEEKSFLEVCQGHDFISLLQMMMVQNHIYSESAIMKRMTDAYSVQDFKSTSLYRELKEWSGNKGWPEIFQVA